MHDGSYDQTLSGFPHPNGFFTGEIVVEEGRTWYRIRSGEDEFETRDTPRLHIVLSDVAHVERYVYDSSGTLILAASEYPKHLYGQTR